jgi:hypothetical protein
VPSLPVNVSSSAAQAAAGKPDVTIAADSTTDKVLLRNVALRIISLIANSFLAFPFLPFGNPLSLRYYPQTYIADFYTSTNLALAHKIGGNFGGMRYMLCHALIEWGEERR